jgi:hypothetical protein
MKTLIATVITALPLLLTGECLSWTPPANALPFKSDCASMARYAAAAFAAKNKPKPVSYSFSGFRGPLRRQEGEAVIYCDDGYITTNSPKGSLVCDGYLTYDERLRQLAFQSGNFAQELRLLKRETARTKRTTADIEEDIARQRRLLAGEDPRLIEAEKRVADVYREARERDIKIKEDYADLEEPVRPPDCRWR